MNITVESSWPSVRLKFLGRFKGGAGFPHDEQGNQTAELPFYKVKDLGLSAPDAVLRETENYIAQDTAQDLGAFIFPAGTIVFAKVGAALLLSRFRVLSRPACIDNNMMGFISNPQICDTAFTLFALNLLDFANIVNPGAVPSLNEEQIAEQVLPLPTLSEQRAIANFLDQATVRLDALIAAKERLLETLAEKRKTLITRAITRGISPNASLRDSGIPWLGKIPAHWETKRVKYLFRHVVEPAPPDNDFELLSLYTDLGVRPRKELEARGNKSTTTDNYWLVRTGDLVVNKLLAWMGAFGMSEYEGVTSPAYDILRPFEGVNTNYYHYLFRCGICFPEFRRRSTGIMDMRLRLYFDEFGDMRVPVPPFDEQRAIVSHIAMETKKLNALREAAERTIALSKERRAALIAAAVTGKINCTAAIA